MESHWAKFKSLMESYQQSFLSNHKGKSVEELWNSFTSTLTKYMDECIPSKIIWGKSSLPWITQEIKRLIRKRDKLCSPFKMTQDQDKRKSFITIRQQIKSKINPLNWYTLRAFLDCGMMSQSAIAKGSSPFWENPRRTNAEYPLSHPWGQPYYGQ